MGPLLSHLDHRQVNQQTLSAPSFHPPTSTSPFICAFGVMYQVQWCDLSYCDSVQGEVSCCFSVLCHIKQGYSMSLFSTSPCRCHNSQLTVSFLPTHTVGFSWVRKIKICWTIYVCLWLQDQAKGNVKNNLHFSNQYFYWVFYNDAKSWKNRLKMISEEFMSVVHIWRALLEKHLCSQKKVFANRKFKRKHEVLGCGNTQFVFPSNAKPTFSVLVESSNSWS